MKHDNCFQARDIMNFNCCNCGKASTNYANGVDICMGCLDKLKLCAICGESLENDYEKVAEILNNMAVSTIGLVDYNCEKEYKIWEVFELFGKKMVGFVCSLNPDYIWKYNSEYDTLTIEKEDVYYTCTIEDEYGIARLLKSTFKIVELKELNDEWIRIDGCFDLHKALINKCKIKIEDIVLDESIGETWINVLFEEILKGNTIEYLKENNQ